MNAELRTCECACHSEFEPYDHFIPIALPLKRMSRDEKLRAMEAIWADLSQDEDQIESPAWHEKALREAECAEKSGKAQFSDWEDAKKRVRRKAAKPA
jgi:hypothetical protein